MIRKQRFCAPHPQIHASHIHLSQTSTHTHSKQDKEVEIIRELKACGAKMIETNKSNTVK